jgi:ABC-type Co2+ transport system permease subunit
VGAQFGAVGQVISKKPPLGYFGAAIADMGSFSVASGTTSTILDPTSTTKVYGLVEPLDAGVASVIGLMLLLWFFNRGRHFEP